MPSVFWVCSFVLIEKFVPLSIRISLSQCESTQRMRIERIKKTCMHTSTLTHSIVLTTNWCCCICKIGCGYPQPFNNAILLLLKKLYTHTQTVRPANIHFVIPTKRVVYEMPFNSVKMYPLNSECTHRTESHVVTWSEYLFYTIQTYIHTYAVNE